MINQVAVGLPGGERLPAPVGKARAVILCQSRRIFVANFFADLRPHLSFGAIVNAFHFGAQIPERGKESEKQNADGRKTSEAG